MIIRYRFMERARELGMTLEHRLLLAEALCAGMEVGADFMDTMSALAMNHLSASVALMVGAEGLRDSAAVTRETTPALIEKDMAENG